VDVTREKIEFLSARLRRRYLLVLPVENEIFTCPKTKYQFHICSEKFTDDGKSILISNRHTTAYSIFGW